MLNAGIDEIPFFVILLVESDHQGDVVLLKVRDVIGWRERTISFGRHGLLKRGTREGDDAILHNPVQVAVLLWESRGVYEKRKCEVTRSARMIFSQNETK